MLSSSHHVQPYDTLGAATVTVPQAAMPPGCGVTVAPPSVSSITYLYALIIRARTVALHSRINHTDLCTLRILPYLVRNSTQNTEIRICYFGYGNAHLLNTETLMVT